MKKSNSGLHSESPSEGVVAQRRSPIYEHSLTEGDISLHLKRIAVPASIGFFFSTMLNVVDTFFAGLISTNALAALSISFPVFFIIIAFNSGLSTGSSALISNALGESNRDEVKKLSTQVVVYGILLYLFLVSFILKIIPSIFQLLGAEGDYYLLAYDYIETIILGSIFFILVYALNAIFLAHGNTKIIRNTLIASCFLNAIFNGWFVYGGLGMPALGFKGIAYATVITMLLAALYIIYEVKKAGYFSYCKPRDFIPQTSTLWAIAKQSVPASMNMMTVAFGIFIITYFLKDFGKEAVAAYGITTRIEQIIMLPVIGFTIATSAIVGQNNGAKKFHRVQETLFKALKYGLIVILFGATGMFAFSQWLVSLFTSEKTMIDIGTIYLKIASFTSFSYVILLISISTLQGMKHPYFPFLMGLTRQILIPPLIFHLLIHKMGFGISSLWWGVLFITWTAAMATFFYTRRVLHQKLPLP